MPSGQGDDGRALICEFNIDTVDMYQFDVTVSNERAASTLQLGNSQRRQESPSSLEGDANARVSAGETS